MASYTRYPPSSDPENATRYHGHNELAGEPNPVYPYGRELKAPKVDKKGYANDPTPAERIEINKGFVDVRAILTGKAWSVQKYIWVIVLIVLFIVLVVLYEIYHHRLIDALDPTFRKIEALPAGWLIPIAVIFILSFPPLFGNEIVHLLVGAVWGLGVGLGIVTAGTLLGEIANFILFKYTLRDRAEKIEKKNFAYACLTRVIRDASFVVAVVVRLSVVPTHISTVIFATSGMTLLSFIAGSILSLPKQLAFVWLGVISVQSVNGVQSSKQRTVNYIITGLLVVVSLASLKWILMRMNRVKLTVLREMRAANFDPNDEQFLPPSNSTTGFTSEPPITQGEGGRQTPY